MGLRPGKELTDAFAYETGAQLCIDALELTQGESGSAILYPFLCAVDFHPLLPDGTASGSCRAEGQLTIRQQGKKTLVHDAPPQRPESVPYLAQRTGTEHDL